MLIVVSKARQSPTILLMTRTGRDLPSRPQGDILPPFLSKVVQAFTVDEINMIQNGIVVNQGELSTTEREKWIGCDSSFGRFDPGACQLVGRKQF